MGQDVNSYDGYFSNYSEYSKTFRTWMVGYGIGGPILLLTSKDVPQTLVKAPELGTIVTLFVLGVSLQVLLALINKWAAWHMYRGAYSLHKQTSNDPDEDTHHSTRSYAIWHWINKQSWIDFLFDVTALLSFSLATWISLKVLLSAPNGA